MRKLFLIFSILFFSKNSISNEFPDFFGCFCEGGLLTGKIRNDQEIIINNEKLTIYERGIFIFAFGRKFDDYVAVTINGKTKRFKVRNKKYKIERINGLPKTKVQPSEKDLKKIRNDQKKIKFSKRIGEKKKLFGKKFILPVEGRLSGFFGSQRILNSKPRSPHNGIDIAQKEGAEILAPASGMVKLVANNMFFTGNTLIMDHGLGLISIFAHMKKIDVEDGQYITIGEKIGEVGMTGRATGPHLHWGVYLQEKPVDPLSLVESKF